MKEVTGELSMTVVTIIAIIAIAGVIGLLSPQIRQYINNTWNQLSGNGSTGNCQNGQVWDAQSQTCR